MSQPRPISIWHPTEVDGEPVFVRPPPGPFGDHYADQLIIHERTRSPSRVCFFGESAAAGYLLAPHVTPAKVLGHRLGSEFEVVDLARTNERLDSLCDVVEASAQLEPDIIVVFVGNNWNLLETPEWSPFYPAAASRERYASALRNDGLAGPVMGADRALRLRVAGLFEQLRGLRTRTVIVVPEVNLVDWEQQHPIPWLTGTTVRAWYRQLTRARHSLRRRAFEDARNAARGMLELDRGVCSTAFGLLGRAAGSLGFTREAVTALRAQVDSVRYPILALLGAPQARQSDQDMLVAHASAAEFECLDLREVFARGTDTAPGRELFYDYCHLTPRGIDLAMGALAALIAGQSGATPTPVGSDVLGRAAIGAAIHSVHRGARGPVVRHWLREGLKATDDSRVLLHDVVQARLADVPSVLTPGQLRAGPLTPQQGWKWPWLDAETLQAIGEVTDAPIECDNASEPRIELWNPLDRFFPEVLGHDDAPAHALLRATWPWTHFALLCHGACLVEFVVRGRGVARLFCEGRCVSQVRLGEGWARWAVRVNLPRGLHKLTVRWPLPDQTGEEALSKAANLLEAGLEGPVHPVFGEIYDVRAIG